MDDGSRALPRWLTDHDAFTAHLNEQLADENPHGKGLRFVNFVLTVLPRVPQVSEFTDFERNKRLSHDKGVDILTAVAESGRQLFVQSKFKIRRTDEIDNILSLFEAFEHEHRERHEPAQGTLFDTPDTVKASEPVYVIATATRTQRLLELYHESKRSSRKFYDGLIAEGRLLIVDGPELLRTLQSVYRKSFEVPSELVLKAATGWLEVKNVRLGVVTGPELIRLYDSHGDGLFFENIRSFLGLERNQDRESVNRRIVKTVEIHPEKMLERNNGITIRASKVTTSDSGALKLKNASIVNGCQTTMCIVASREQVGDSLLVPVKVIESTDLWEVAHSANYQNRVRQIDLDLAKYLRPQIVQRAAARLGIAVKPDASQGVTNLIATISDTQVTYEDTKALYKGVFSERPTNVFDNNYNKLQTAVLDVIYEHEDVSNKVFEALFALSGAARKGREESNRVYSQAENKYFQRFQKPEYNAYISLLAAGAVAGINLAKRAQTAQAEAERLLGFLDAAREVAEVKTQEFIDAYLMSYELLSEAGFASITAESGDALVSQEMWKKITQTPYETYYNTLRMRMQGELARRQRQS